MNHNPLYEDTQYQFDYKNTTKTPYFYIIRYLKTGQQYAGIRHKKGGHPSELLQPRGYHTSSKVVRKIIANEGLDAFEVVSIVTDFDGIDLLEYEEWFHKENNCALSPHWLNLRNSNGQALMTAEADENRIATCIKRFNTRYASQSKEFKEKVRQTNLSRRGVDHQSKCPYVRNKIRETHFNKTGYYEVFADPAVQAKSRQTYFECTGYTHQNKNPDVIKAKELRYFKKHGVHNPAQLEEVRNKRNDTLIHKNGASGPLADVAAKLKYQQSCLVKFGCPSPLQSRVVIAKSLETKRNNPFQCSCVYCKTFFKTMGSFQKHIITCKYNPEHPDHYLVKPELELIQEVKQFLNSDNQYECVCGQISTSVGNCKFHWDNCLDNPLHPNHCVSNKDGMYECTHCGAIVKKPRYRRNHGVNCIKNKDRDEHQGIIKQPVRIKLNKKEIYIELMKAFLNNNNEYECSCGFTHTQPSRFKFHWNTCLHNPDYENHSLPNSAGNHECKHCGSIIRPARYRLHHGIYCSRNKDKKQ